MLQSINYSERKQLQPALIAIDDGYLQLLTGLLRLLRIITGDGPAVDRVDW